jgi:SAM-dependent methyltransferase
MTLPVPVPRPCPICGETARTLIHAHPLAPVEDVSLHAGYQVVACAHCAMVYADGIPAQEAFDHYYQACSKYEDGTRMGQPSAVDQARFRAIAEELAAALPDRDGAIAEIGAATGGLLGELKRRGFRQLLGVDPSPLCVATTRERHGLEAVTGTIFQPIPGGPHAGILAVGVIEHIRDLDRALANLRAALVPAGLLYLEVPDLEGFHRTNEAPFQEFSTEHINFFTRASLDNLLARHGFEPAFGRIAQRLHSGGSSMQVVAQAYRKGTPPAAFAPRPDPAGPAAAAAYRDHCAAQCVAEHELLGRLAREGQPVAVWGAGTVASRLMATSPLRDCQVVAFLDSNPHLQGHRLAGVGIHPPEWLRGFPGPVLIASRGYAGEIERLIRDQMGLANPLLTL